MFKAWYLALALAASQNGYSQETAPSTATSNESPHEVATTVTPSSTCCLRDGTPVTLEILDPLDSSLLKRGDKFRIRLAEPAMAGGDIVIPAGTEGMGEVVHAEKSRAGGKAGELLIAARHLDHQGNLVRLRGLKLGGTGKDNTAAAIAVAIAAGPFALFVQGREIIIPAGTHAQAKVAQDFPATGVDIAPATTPSAIADALESASAAHIPESEAATKAAESPGIAGPNAADITQPPKPKE